MVRGGWLRLRAVALAVAAPVVCGCTAGVLALPPQPVPRPVLPPASGPAVDATKLRAVVAPLIADPRLGRHVAFAAYDLGHDRLVWQTGAGVPFIPASTLKLLTTMAALSVLGPDTTFSTTVVHPRGSPGELVLVGGGDPLLARRRPPPSAMAYPQPATLNALATRTARAIQRSGRTTVSVRYDAGLFAGPAVNPAWRPSYLRDEVVTRISPLWVDHGITPSGRSPDPALAAAQDFVTALRARGLRVVGAPAPRPTGPSDPVVAEVTSPPLEQVVDYLLEHSDNEGAEVLLRHVAIASGRTASFLGGVRAVHAVMAGLGVPWHNVRMYDGSGLARGDRLTLRTLVTAIRVAAVGHPRLRPVVTELPVAGFTGSLAYRFGGPAADPGRGFARAKTGTLSHVHGLAGTTVDADGSQLAFVVVADQVPVPDTLAARAKLDAIVSALSACGCAE